MNEINFQPIVTKVALAPTQRAANDSVTTDGANFGTALKNALDSVNAIQARGSELSAAYQLDDPNVSLEETMISVSKANVAFQGLVQARNRLVSAYHDIMGMQV